MTSATAECVLKTETRGVRLAEFRYKHQLVMDQDIPEGFTDSLRIICSDHDIEDVWTIQLNYRWDYDDAGGPDDDGIPIHVFFCYWDGVTFQSNNNNVSGNFVIRSPAGYSDGGSFRTNNATPTYQKKLEDIRCRAEATTLDTTIQIIIQVQHADERTPSFIANYEKLLESKNLWDFTFVVGGEEIPACKALISVRSDVLATMVTTDMVEKKSGRAEIHDTEPDIFRLLLSFIYCGKFESQDPDELLKLMIAADKYAVEFLVGLCAYRVSYKLSTNNAADALIAAHLVNSDFLKKDSMKFINENKKEIAATAGFQRLIQCHKNLALEQFQYVMERSVVDRNF